MARALRVGYTGAFYHVIYRGNAGDDIFKSLRDREKFLAYLQTAVKHYGLKIPHTYCLMTNHYHLLVETPEANLGGSNGSMSVMPAILTANGNGVGIYFKDVIKPSWWMPMNISNSYRAIFT